MKKGRKATKKKSPPKTRSRGRKKTSRRKPIMRHSKEG